MRDATVIQPNGSITSTLEQHDLAADPDAIRVLGFPKHLFEFEIVIERKLIQNRETTISVTVDLVTNTCRKNDIYPKLQRRSLSAPSLLNPRVERESAAETAHSFVRRKINRWYKSFSTPEIRPVRDDVVFKLFWIIPAPTAETVHVIDTITNQLTARDITIDEFTRKSRTKPLSE